MIKQNTNVAAKQYYYLLAGYLKVQKWRVLVLVMLILTSIGLALVNPQIVRFYLDAVEAGAALDRLLRAALLFIGVAILRQVILVAVTYLGELVAWSSTNSLRADLALHCLKLDMSFHKQYRPGELIERVDGDVNQLANFFSQLFIRLTGNLLLVIGVIVLLSMIDWRLGLSVAIVSLAGILVLRWLNRLTIPRLQVVREAEAKLFGFMEEWLNGMEEIRTSGAEEYILVRLYQALRVRYQKTLSAMRIRVLVSDLPIGVFALAYSAAHLFSYALFRDSLLTIGGVYLVFYYIGILEGPLWEIIRQVEDLQRATASIVRITEIRALQSTIQDGGGVRFPPGPLEVVVDGVTFHYQDDPGTDVLKDISLTLKPGTVLGLLGRTGSGKSTLTRLLFRLYDPSSGVIYMGGDAGGGEPHGMFDIRHSSLGDVRRHVGLVPQEVQLFHATVRQNLTLFDDAIPDERIIQALEDIGLGGWLAQLPEGLDTHLDSGSSGLSAGEAQLVAFGRVFLADPGLVILDEASSRLDPATERLIDIAVDRLLKDRTAIIIAHRLGTVQRADEIMILDDGAVIEYGTRTDLIRDPGSVFSRLLQTGLQEALA